MSQESVESDSGRNSPTFGRLRALRGRRQGTIPSNLIASRSRGLVIIRHPVGENPRGFFALVRAKKDFLENPRNNAGVHAMREGEKRTIRKARLRRRKALKEFKGRTLMITNIFNKLFDGFSQTPCNPNPSRRNRRINRHFSISQGIEGLEGRLAPSGGIAPILVTVTNQTDTGTSTPDDPTITTVSMTTVSQVTIC
jgi:hypothetical protein